jgi:hypothetical protein
MTISTSPLRSEREVVEAVQVDEAWSLVEEFSTLMRNSGTEQERQAVRRITHRLDAWKIPYKLYEPELLISLPGPASLTVGDRSFRAKTPSMAKSTSPGGRTAPVLYQPSGFAKSVNDIFAAADLGGDVEGKIVVTEGLPMPGKIAGLEAHGAVGVVCIGPGERIHEGICTSIWGSPDLTSCTRKPNIPVVSVNNADGKALLDLIQGGGATATITAEHEERWRTIPVLVAEITGTVEPDRFVLVHGHIDSWHVGIGDNATGDATLLEVARVLNQHKDQLTRSVRVAWWSGHSHGRYAGSTWFADTFANDLRRNCIVHINCDSPGCRDATVYEDVYWMAEVEAFAKQAVVDFTGVTPHGRSPIRAGDISFNNLGVSTFFMLTSTMPADVREQKNFYAVGGCGGNIEWHTEADTMEIADRDNLLRDMRMYAGAAYRAANIPVHPLDFRATIDQLVSLLEAQRPDARDYIDLDGTISLADETRKALDSLYAKAGSVQTIDAARSINNALLKIGRSLVSLLYSREGTYRQDPALDIPLLPDFATAIKARRTVAPGILRTEFTRARNRVEGVLLDVREYALLASS